NSIGGNGLLKAFRPDSLILIHNKNKKSFDSVYVAIKNISLSNGEYIAIVSPVMIDEFDEEVALK
ncbi:MAG: sigma-E processing peptidase SpoIIGA, partial [Oscillospiraceae bacterium]